MGCRLDYHDRVVSVVHFTDHQLANPLTRVTTQFVRDRITETPWYARAHIGDLLHVERTIPSDGPHGWAAYVVWHPLGSSYSTSEKFHQGSQEYEEAESRRRRTAAQRAAAKEARDLRCAKSTWERAGGTLD